MQNNLEDDLPANGHPLYQAFELDADERPTDEDRPMAGPSAQGPTGYRVWRCNGVSIGVRFHN